MPVPVFTQSLKPMILNVCLLLAMALGVAYLFVMGFAYFLAEKLIFPAPPASYRSGDGIETISTARGDRIALLYLAPEKPAPLLLYSHGNGEDLGHVRPLLEAFRASGIAVLSYDYPGYGISSGQATETGCYAAADAVYRHALDELGYTPDRIILYGRSVGSGPACWLADKYPVAGLILEGAFSSAFRVMTRIKLLPWDKFDNQSRLHQVSCPVLILHGRKDPIIPFAHAERNAATVGPQVNTLWIDDAGHNNLIDHAGKAYWETLLKFIHNPKNDGP